MSIVVTQKVAVGVDVEVDFMFTFIREQPMTATDTGWCD